MSKVTKKDLKERLDGVQNRFAVLVGDLKASGHICESTYAPFAHDYAKEQADHDAVIAILDSKEPKLKQLDQSVAKNSYVCIESTHYLIAVGTFGSVTGFDDQFHTNFVVNGNDMEYSADVNGDSITLDAGDAWQAKFKRVYESAEQNSLIERKELTGSDLCRAMLERGDKYVMCANKSAYDDWPRAIALNERGRMYYISGEYSYDANDSIYPINNQGEPLTAADVGL